MRKPLYRLDDTSRKFWLRVKEVLTEMGLRIMDRDEAFYSLHENRCLRGAVLTHVDYFKLAADDFVEKVLEEVERELTISKIERDKFYFTGLDVATVEDRITVSMNDYMQSVKDMKDIRKVDHDEELSRLEMKEYRKIAGKISWLANSTRSDRYTDTTWTDTA